MRYLYSVDLCSLDVAVLRHHCPVNSSRDVVYVVGSCDGLVLLYDGKCNVTLWNPFTRKSQLLPYAKIDIPGNFTGRRYTQYGLGYDSVSDDYKVVRVVESEVKVYSLKSDLWRRIEDFPYYICYDRCHGEYVGGALHWVVCLKYDQEEVEGDYDCFIAAFDLATEEYRLVPLPDLGDERFDMLVGVFEGCLCMLCFYYYNSDRISHVDVWVMKSYGVKESWNKLFSVAQPKHIEAFKYMRPLAYSENFGEVLLVQDHEKLLWFEPENGLVKRVEVGRLPYYFELQVCVQSLVPLPNRGLSKGKKKQPHSEEEDGTKRCFSVGGVQTSALGKSEEK